MKFTPTTEEQTVTRTPEQIAPGTIIRDNLGRLDLEVIEVCETELDGTILALRDPSPHVGTWYLNASEIGDDSGRFEVVR